MYPNVIINLQLCYDGKYIKEIFIFKSFILNYKELKYIFKKWKYISFFKAYPYTTQLKHHWLIWDEEKQLFYYQRLFWVDHESS